MHKMTVAAMAITGATAIILAGWYAGLTETLLDDSNGAKTVCETGVRSTLKAPSTYRRVNITYTPQPPLTFEQYKRYNLTAGCVFSEFGQDACTELPRMYLAASIQDELKKAGVRRPTKRQRTKAREAVLRQQFSAINKRPLDQLKTALVIVTYDAENDFGAPIRSTSTCRFGPAAPSKRFAESNIYDDSST